MRRTFILALLVAFVAGTGLASAQALTGTVAGKVTDEQGGVLPGVTVTLTGSTGSQTQVTDARGEYRFLGLVPGTYNVKADLVGFRPKEQQGVVVNIGRAVVVNLTLPVGGIAETVNVIASSVTVDTTTTSTDTTVSQDLLFSMPMTHANPSVNLLQYVPGVTVNNGGSSAFGGAADYGSALMIDGVDTRDPEGGSSWVFYNYNIIEEVQVGSLGQQAEYGGFTGAVINTVTKSGGNRFSFLSEYRYTGDKLSSKNASAEKIQANPLLGTPVQVLKMHDYTVQLGGPLIKDKLFFFGTAQRYEISQRRAPRLIRGEISPRFNFKLTYQVTPNDLLTGSFQYDQYNQTGRTAFIPGAYVTSHDQTIDQDSPEWDYTMQYRKVFGPSTFLEAKFSGWWGYYDLNPVIPDSTHFDGETNAYSGGAGYTAQYDRTRNQLNAALTKYAKLAGTHTFKFGVEIERSSIRDRFEYSNGVFYYDLGGPYTAYGYSYDLKGKNKRESYYAQDQWKAGRFTANIGLRLDNIRGEATVSKQDLYKTFSVGPRLGFAVDVTGKGTSVVRAYYGRLYESAIFGSWSYAVPGMSDTVYYDVGENWSTLTEYYRVSGESKYTVADNIKHHRVDEYNVAYEQQVGRNTKFTATYIYRKWGNFISSTLIDGLWTPGTWTTTLGTSLPIYSWANRDEIDEKYVIHNVDNLTYNMSDGTTRQAHPYRTYQGLMLILQRSFRDRWQAQISYVRSLTKGTVSNTGQSGAQWGSQYNTPNTILGLYDGPTEGNRANELKIFVGYQIPKIEVSANAFFQYVSGRPFAAYARLSRGTINWTSNLNVNITERGSSAPEPNTQASVFQFTDPETSLDVRFEKLLRFGFHRFGVYADIQNLLNRGAATSIQSRYPSSSTIDFYGEDLTQYFGTPTVLQSARQVTFGVRWSF
jgi:hypothetical protein